MSTVAEQLRAAREAKNLTVEQVADLTKMRTDHVRALEEGNFSAFSAPIYIRGSVKNYASALKLDGAKLLVELAEELKGTGVTITALCPGITATNMLAGAQQESEQLGRLPQFVVGSAAEVVPVAEIGEYKFRPGNLSLSLADDYSNMVRGKKVAA